MCICGGSSRRPSNISRNRRRNEAEARATRIFSPVVINEKAEAKGDRYLCRCEAVDLEFDRLTEREWRILTLILTSY